MTAIKSSPPPKAMPRKDLKINQAYEAKAKALLRDGMAEAGMSYDALADALNGMGIEITARGLENKISRGAFPMSFFLQCMTACNVSVDVSKIETGIENDGV